MEVGRPTLSDAIDLLLKNEPAVFRTATETLFKVPSPPPFDSAAQRALPSAALHIPRTAGAGRQEH